MLHRASELVDGFFGTTSAMENGYEIWNVECLESVQSRCTVNSSKQISRL